MASMRVAVNAMQVRAAKSGVGQYIHALMEGLLRLDDTTEYHIFTSPANAANYTYRSPRSTTRPWGLPESWKALRLANEYATFPLALRRAGADILHAPSNLLPVYKVCPYAVTIHDLSYHVQPERCPFLRRQYWYAATRRTTALADIIITVSQNSRRDIERFFPRTAGRIRVIPEAAHPRFRVLDEGEAAPTLGKHGIDRPYILCVSTLEPGKNIVRLISAFEAVAQDFPDHLLLLVGDRGWSYGPIEEAVRSSPQAARIRLMGHIPDDQVVHLYNLCDLFVFPSLYEGFGLPPLEAMACGAPVVCSNSSSLPEVVGDAAITFPPEDTSALALAMRRILSDRTVAEDLRAQGLERARLFSWERTARLTLEAYRETLARGS